MSPKKDEAPHVFILGEGGSVFKLDIPVQADIVERIQKGYIRRVKNRDGDPYDGEDTLLPDGTLSEVPIPTERPALSAPKGVWVGWAVAESERRGDPISPDDAEALTKDDLIERFGIDPSKPAA